MSPNPGRKQRNRHSDEALAFVVKSTQQVASQYLSSPWLPDILAQKYQWHTLFIRTMEAASSLASRNIWPDLFNAYLILGSRWFSHHEAIEMLLTTGRYGDCMVLLRSLLEDTDLTTFFSYYPEDATEWNERLSREPVWSDEVYRKGIQNFRMPEIWRKLKEKDIEPVGERDYPILSATVHSTPWGTRFYGRIVPGAPDLLHISLAPMYDAAASFTASLILQGTYPRPIHAFLTSCIDSKAPRSQWHSIKARYDALIEEWQAKMDVDSWFRSEMASAEERILTGEEQEVVLQELCKRLEEKYGEAPNSTDGDIRSNHVGS